MRTVSGPTERIVVVGGGLGGLAAALQLAGAGRQVLVCEREPHPGGRAGLLELDGYRFDTGPTVLTMPDLIEDAFAAVGERMADWLTLRPVAPLYRARYHDGSRLDVHADPEAMADEIAALCGPAEAAGYRRFVDFAGQLYRYQMTQFIDRNIDSPLDLVRPNLARLLAIGGFRRLAPKVASYLRDPRTQRIFSFQAMYAGVAPTRALALYAVISYMDTVGGVFFPEGGIHALPRALAGAAEKHGVRFRYGTTVTRVEMRGGRAVAVHTADGARIPADVVVLNPDLPVAYEHLLGHVPRRLRRLTYSPSCFLLLAGSRASYPGIVHHNLHFGAAWERTFAELIGEGRCMTDPSFLVSVPTYSDPALAPAGRHSYYVLFPTPNLAARPDWARLAPVYRDQVLATLEARGYPGFGAAIEVESCTTPVDWAARGMAAGTPFAAAHSFRQTGPFRPGNLYGENVVFTGSGTQPGVGVPMVLISGRLAAERVLGR
jgi:phytoene desaturase